VRNALFLRLALWTYDRCDGPKTLDPNFFPRRLSGFLAAAPAPKKFHLGSSALLRPFGFRTVTAVMGGPASPEEKASGETQKDE
jgi:hypothetical protein